MDVNSDTSLDEIINTSVDNSTHDLVIGLAAQTFLRLGQWIDEGDIFSLLSEFEIPVYVWHAMDEAPALLDKALERYAHENVRFVVVENLGRGEHFRLFEPVGCLSEGTAA